MWLQAAAHVVLKSASIARAFRKLPSDGTKLLRRR
jgi:hypothetical protein